MARFLCTGDLHLGAGADLGNVPGERLAEQEAVWLSIVKMANELEATILFAGDAWERRRPTPAELLAFRNPLHWLKFPLVGIAGNHDVEAFERPTGYDVFQIDGGRAYVETRPQVTRVAGASIAGLPWAPPGRLVAESFSQALDGDRDALNDRLAQGLVDIARGLFSEMADDQPRILLAHWSVGGAETPTGVPVELFREPVLPLEALASIGFDAIVLGHIHKPQRLEPPGGSPLFYVGSPMPLNFGEVESDHVAWLLESGPEGFQLFQIPVESRRLVTLDADAIELGGGLGGGPVWVAGGKRTPQGNEPVDVQGAIVKLKIRATSDLARRLDVAQVKRDLLDLGAHKVWSVQVDVEREQIARGVEIDETVDDVEAFTRWLAATGVTAVSEDLLDLHRDYLTEAST